MKVVRFTELAFGQLPGRRAADPLPGAELGEICIRFAHLTAGPRAPHRHPHSVELTYVLEGEGTHWQEGETERVGPGDLVVVPVGVRHATIPDAGGEMLLYCVFPVATLEGNVEESDEPLAISLGLPADET